MPRTSSRVRAEFGILLGGLLSLVPVLQFLSSSTSAAGPTTPLAFAWSDLDLTQTRQFLNGQPQPVDEDQLRRTLGFADRGQTWRFADEAKAAPLRFQYLLVFKQPLALGTTLCTLEHRGGSATQQLAYWDPQAKSAPDIAQADHWKPIPLRHTFAPQFKTQALLLTETRPRGKSAVAHWLCLAPRLHSVTRQAVGSAEKAPFGAHPNALPRGQAWFNTAPDPSPGSAKQVLRGPVSDAVPSWYILSWEEPQALSAFYLSSNAEQFQLLTYRGDPRVHPALAPASDWKRIDTQIIPTQPKNQDTRQQFLTCAPVLTTAVKLQIISCLKNSSVAEIDRFDAFTNLQEQPVPTTATTAQQPFAIHYEQPVTGPVAMVITTEDGRHVRNLLAQQERAAGPVAEPWDLKDEQGRMVPPGTYRWKAITAPPLSVRYQMTVTPGAPQYFAGQTPWLTGESGNNGWLADHATHTSGTALGDHIYFGAPGVEGGVCFIECDLTGRKQWGKHSFASFTGLRRLAAGNQVVYIHERDNLARLDPATHEIQVLSNLTSETRQGNVTGMAAANEEIYLSFKAPVPAFANATLAKVVDLENCMPLYPAKIADPLGTRRVTPNPRLDFLRLLRLSGTPAGQGSVSQDQRERLFPIHLETDGDDENHQYILIAFHSPVPLGSVVFPCPEKLSVEFSVLKPNAKYPPNPRANQDWIPFETQPTAGWACVAAPPHTATRALRIHIRKPGTVSNDPLDALLSKDKPGSEPSLDGLLDKPKQPSDPLDERTTATINKGWFARLDGLKLLQRRYASVTERPAIQVNSGKVNAAGEWDAERTAAISAEEPGIYVMEWKSPQPIRGLAIQEIDGEQTEIDIWEGPAGAAVTIAGDANWRNVASYTQPRRDAYHPAFERNDWARYLDGYVDFQTATETRAVRLRVVKQWADANDRGTATLRYDRGGRTLDPRRCRVYGVTALRELGDEPPTDALAYQRIEVRDAATGKVKRELPGTVDHTLCVNPQGELFGIHQKRVVQVDRQTGAATPILPAVDGVAAAAQRLAISSSGEFYVYVLPEKVIQVYRPNGELVRTVGHAGGQQPGPWDPEKFLDVNQIFVDRNDSLWVVESQNVPRRIVQFDATGKLVKELLGNTNYGGGGVLDGADKSRLFFNNVEYHLDWQTGKSHVKNLLAKWMPEDLVPIHIDGRTYLASAPLSHQATQPVGIVYLLDNARGTARIVAAFGQAHQFDWLKHSSVLSLLAPGKVLSDYSFNWSDQNGTGEVEPNEVTFELRDQPRHTTYGRFNQELTCCGAQTVFQVEKFLADGTPIFVKKTLPAAAVLKLQNGNLFNLSGTADFRPGQSERGGQETQVYTKTGEKVWSYETAHPSVSGLWLPPFKPGYITNEFGVIGHEVATVGDLGEFLVIHANNGQWKIWTADGLLAGTILKHKLDPTSKGIGTFKTIARDDEFEDLTADQEHFHGHFVKSQADGKYYIVHGGNFITVSEVVGIDQFQRLGGTISVSNEQSRDVLAWEQEQARREVKSVVNTIECLPIQETGPLEVAELDHVKFNLGYDETHLHMKWTVQNLGALSNSGVDFQRLFKTGAAVDLHIGTDPEASPARRGPVRGDQRLLLTYVAGKPKAVLYDVVAAPGTPLRPWETATPAGGTTRFERVLELTDVRMNLKTPESGGYVLTAAVPLKTLGLQIHDGLRLKLDWGVLVSEDGNSVKRRLYWSNPLATGTTDEAVEARLEPQLWGTVIFASKSQDERRITETLQNVNPTKKPVADVDDLLDDLKSTPKPR